MPDTKVIVRQKIRINYIIGQVYARDLANTICYCKNHYKLHFHLQFKNKKAFSRIITLSQNAQNLDSPPPCSHLINFGSTLLSHFSNVQNLTESPPPSSLPPPLTKAVNFVVL